MNHTEVIKAAMKETGTKQMDFVQQLGLKSNSVISERINQKNISMRALLEMLDIMGYEIVVRKIDGDSEYPIRMSDYQ